MKIRDGYSFLNARFFGNPVPLIVNWGLTYRCNSRCEYCAVNGPPTDPLTTDQVRASIGELAGLGMRYLCLTGGEPLLRDDIGDIIDCAVSHGIRVKLNTNGKLVPDKIAALEPLGVLCISLDGPPQVHDLIRGRGSYAHAMDAARAARARGVRLAFAATVTSHNLDQINFLVDKAAEFNASIGFQPATATLLGSAEPNHLAPEPKEFRDFISRLRKAKKKASHITNTHACLEHLAHWPEPKPMVCASGRIGCRIEPDGAVVHCSRARRPQAGLVQNGAGQAFKALHSVTCNDCWCSSRVELNLLWALNFGSLLEQARRQGW